MSQSPDQHDDADFRDPADPGAGLDDASLRRAFADSDAPASDASDHVERPDNGDADPDPMARLRALLVGPEQQQIHVIQQRLDTPEIHARDVSDVLAEAVHLRSQQDDRLSHELYPTVEKALQTSVRRNPRAITEAIFPIMGPAIRKAISDILSRMVESLNQALEHSLSPRSLKWRLRAWQTGRSFTEIALLHTLAYRVEQVFLIHRQTGLLLLHVAADPTKTRDGDMVSGMLTAIQDFVRDSFEVDDADAVESLKIGELTVLAESGPHVALAAVVRGSPPRALREAMELAVETVQLDHGERLADFDGDASPFEVSRPSLEACLMEERKESEKRGVPWLGLLVVIAIVASIIGWFAWGAVRERRWTDLVARIDALPGVVVTRITGEGGDRTVHLLRDPLADDPAGLVAASSFADVTLAVEPYQSLDADIVRRRAALNARTPQQIIADARRLLAPPDSVDLSFTDGVLVALGSADLAWIRRARTIAPDVAGVLRYDDALVQDEGPLRFDAARRRLEQRSIRFTLNSDSLDADQVAAIAAAASDVRELGAAGGPDRAAIVVVLGHTDDLGTDEAKDRLSLARARRVVDALRAAGVGGVTLRAVGMSDRDPLVPETTDEARAANRRVSFRIDLTDRPAAPQP